MKICYISILCIVFASCGLYEDYYSEQASDFSYMDNSFLSSEGSFYYPPVVEPLSPSEFRFDYGGRSVNEQEYEQIREIERRQTRINELERQNRGLRSRWPYQRYDPLDDLSSSPSGGYRRYNPLDDL